MYEQVDGGEGGVAVSDPIPTWRLEQEEEEEGAPFNSRRMKLMLYILNNVVLIELLSATYTLVRTDNGLFCVHN